MLSNPEVKIGNLYAWDTSVTEPAFGCNLFTITDTEVVYDTCGDFGERLTGNTHLSLTVFSLDGRSARMCGQHCLISARHAFERLDAINKAKASGQECGSFNSFSIETEIKYLGMFKKAFLEYGKKNALDDPIFHTNDDEFYPSPEQCAEDSRVIEWTGKIQECNDSEEECDQEDSEDTYPDDEFDNGECTDDDFDDKKCTDGTNRRIISDDSDIDIHPFD